MAPCQLGCAFVRIVKRFGGGGGGGGDAKGEMQRRHLLVLLSVETEEMEG